MSGLPIRPSFQDLSPDGSLSEPRHQKQQTWYTRINMKSLFLGTMSNTSWSSWISDRYCGISSWKNRPGFHIFELWELFEGSQWPNLLGMKGTLSSLQVSQQVRDSLVSWQHENQRKVKWCFGAATCCDLAFGFSDRPSTSLGEKIMEPWKPSCIGSWI